MSNKRLVPLNLVALSSAPTGGMRTGDLYFNTVDSSVYVYDGSAWVVASGGGGASIDASASAPSDPGEGDAWFNTAEGRLYVYYDSYWIEVGANGGAIGPEGPQGDTGVVAATSPVLYDSETQTVSLDLAASAITINGASVQLGGSVSITGESFHPFLLMGA